MFAVVCTVFVKCVLVVGMPTKFVEYKIVNVVRLEMFGQYVVCNNAHTKVCFECGFLIAVCIMSSVMLGPNVLTEHRNGVSN